MDQPYFVKSLPAPLQALYRPMVLISLALHGLLLALPTGFEAKPTEPPKEPEKVQITQLPTAATATNPSPLAAPRPTPRATPLVRQSPRLQPTPLRRSAIPPVSQTRPLSRPQQAPSPTQQPSQPTPPQTTADTAQPQTQTTGNPTQAPGAPSQDPFATFPVYQPSGPGSLGILPDPEVDKSALNTSAPIESVVAFYEQELPLKEFASQLTTDETNLKVYSVSKGGVSRYLHLIFQGESTVIVAANQPLDLENLDELVVEPPEAREFAVLLGEIINVDTLSSIGLTDLIDPGPLQSAEVTNILGASRELPLQTLAVGVEDGLRGKEFQVEVISETFGGGPLYQVKKGRFTGYLSLVPTTDGKTGIITLRNSPLQ